MGSLQMNMEDDQCSAFEHVCVLKTQDSTLSSSLALLYYYFYLLTALLVTGRRGDDIASSHPDLYAQCASLRLLFGGN